MRTLQINGKKNERYKVLLCGTILSVKYNKPLKTFRNQNGYHTVSIYYNGLKKTYCVHRLVAETYYGKCPKGKEVNHKDRDRYNNAPINLEYITHKENMIHLSQTKKAG
jgi:hypothetical protein